MASHSSCDFSSPNRLKTLCKLLDVIRPDPFPNSNISNAALMSSSSPSPLPSFFISLRKSPKSIKLSPSASRSSMTPRASSCDMYSPIEAK
ncbi:hypothetical protein RHMOL_Rhmol01G0023200 [Rhododendron molle]|uniref:Uncharacterized protein n=1 Tax=Rhododendron molle TaxID=49168 RepID=A0ACC0Q0H2_RHOML|nr:hypothetical protein RHMOL_Rhmol01G0023200 [Rhododendron molle]